MNLGFIYIFFWGGKNVLYDGIYEQLISKGLERELELSDKYRLTEPIDAAEASKILAKYVAVVVERGMENLKDQGANLQEQVALANQLIADILERTKEADFAALSVAERAEQLLALFDRKNSILALDEKTQLVRPETSIAQSSLFTGAVHEPQMYSELKKEIVSSNRIDILVSFIKWSGLRLMMEELKHFTENGGDIVMTPRTGSGGGAACVGSRQASDRAPRTPNPGSCGRTRPSLPQRKPPWSEMNPSSRSNATRWNSMS